MSTHNSPAHSPKNHDSSDARHAKGILPPPEADKRSAKPSEGKPVTPDTQPPADKAVAVEGEPITDGSFKNQEAIKANISNGVNDAKGDDPGAARLLALKQELEDKAKELRDGLAQIGQATLLELGDDYAELQKLASAGDRSKIGSQAPWVVPPEDKIPATQMPRTVDPRAERQAEEDQARA